MKNLRAKSQGAPLGVHIHPGGVAVVWAEDRKENGAVRSEIKGHSEITITTKGGPAKEAQKTALKKAIENLGSPTTNCVIAMLPNDVITRRLQVAPKANPKQIESFAFLEAERIFDLPADKLQVALDNLPGTNDKLMSIAKREVVEELVEIVKEVGLVPVGIDVPLAAWQRSMRENTDAILDLSYRRPVLYVFADPIGEQTMLNQGMTVERLAGDVRKTFIDMRKSGSRASEVKRIHILGESDLDKLVELLREDAGLREIGPLKFGDVVNPEWAYAAAIATWGSKNR